MPLFPSGPSIAASDKTYAGGVVVFSGSAGGNVTVGTNGQTVLFSAGGGGGGSVNFSAGTTSNNLGAVVFSNSGGVSFGLNGSTITATVQTNYLTTAMASNRGSDFVQATAAFAGTSASGTIASNGISISIGPYLTTAMQSNAVTLSNIKISAGTSSANLSAVTFANSNGVSFGLNGSTVTGSVATSLTNLNLSAGTTSNNLSAFVFSNSNSVSFGLNGSTVTATVAYPAQTNQTLGLYAVSNTTQNSSTTVDARTISFQGAGVASVGYSNGSVVVSVPAGGGGLTNINVSAGTTSNNLSNVVFSNSNGVTFGLNGSTVTASVNAGGGGATFSSTVLGKQLEWAQSSASLGQNSIYIFPEVVHEAISASVVKIPVMISHSSSAAASVQRGHTMDFGVYTRHATNSTVLTQHYSTSYTFAASHSSNVSWRISAITAVGNSTSYNTLTASSAGLNLSASVHGAREFILPWNTVLAPGEYWFAIRQSSSSAGAAGSLFQVSHVIASSVTQNRMGVSINATNDGIARNIGYGTYSASSGALPAGISMTQINASAINPIIFMLSATV